MSEDVGGSGWAVCCGPETQRRCPERHLEFDYLHDDNFSEMCFPRLHRFVYFFGGAKILMQMEDVDTS